MFLISMSLVIFCLLFSFVDYVPVKGEIISKCPSANEWIKKLWYIYTMEFYAAERKKELIPFAMAWMELESIMLSEISQAVRDKYHDTVFLCRSLPEVLDLMRHGLPSRQAHESWSQIMPGSKYHLHLCLLGSPQ